ncbi:MAG: TonB-dependent receptor plug domain-containing protein, partial [Planctomycetales bacterium]
MTHLRRNVWMMLLQGCCAAAIPLSVSQAQSHRTFNQPAVHTQPPTDNPLADAPPEAEAILDLNLEQLGNLDVNTPSLNLEVSTVERSESTVGKSPTAIFVITNEMIRRSGARSVPEVLRMAPGVQVARMNTNTWAISIRGFNDAFANKLLVQIDGRTVYTPLFAGVYWDVQDVLLEDVSRIEVIRGPGATVWGANAVNGVINVITKSAKDTQGFYSQAGAGDFQRGFGSVRQGGELGKDLSYRLWGKWYERGRSRDSRFATNDDTRLGHGGFRLDYEPCKCDHFTLQSDLYDGDSGHLLAD